jgi:pilus assembly protein CpaB
MKAARLVVLGVAVVAGGLAAILASGPDAPPPVPAPLTNIDTTEVLIASHDIGPGAALSEADLKWQIWPTAAAANFIKKPERPDAISDLKGAITRSSLTNGEPIQESRVIKVGSAGYMAAILPQGMRALSVEILPETGAGGFVLPGDHVDVILTRRDKEAEKATGVETVFVSETLLTNIRALAIDQTVEDKNGQKVLVGKTATLEVRPAEAEALALARSLGTVSLALRSVVDNAQSGDAADKGARRGVNMVRFGVTLSATPK